MEVGVRYSQVELFTSFLIQFDIFFVHLLYVRVLVHPLKRLLTLVKFYRKGQNQNSYRFKKNIAVLQYIEFSMCF